MNPAEFLRAAADRVQFQGWTQGTYARDAGEVADTLRRAAKALENKA